MEHRAFPIRKTLGILTWVWSVALCRALRKEHVRTGKPITKLNFPTVEERALLGRVGTINRSSGVVHATHSPAKSGGLPRVEDHDKDDSSDDDDEGFVTTKVSFQVSIQPVR